MAFDCTKGKANYYVQKLFSTNKGTDVLNMTLDKKPLTGQQGLYATAAIDNLTNEIILKIVNTSDKMQDNSILLQTAGKISKDAKLIVLKNENLDGINTIENPESIKPVTEDISIRGKKIELTVVPYSLTVMRIKML
ncbi:MAG TPA: alpha-L-arabinofuranosidase C-terminal domain-containing protein [Bacteroidales bacterium]|nr:alpha-L-arabinofuranosidase C-terminal domain-containing protein [Bacteroidales bacterium]